MTEPENHDYEERVAIILDSGDVNEWRAEQIAGCEATRRQLDRFGLPDMTGCECGLHERGGYE